MKKILLAFSFILINIIVLSSTSCNNDNETNKENPKNQTESIFPQITMINQIQYTDKYHPIGGCGFLLDIGNDTLAVTAKHVIKFFKSEKMETVSFDNTLVEWKMFPKNRPDDIVITDQLLNEDTLESLKIIPAAKDWLLFSIKEKSEDIHPVKFRTSPIEEGEPVYIIGWRYTDKDCPQVIYEGNYLRAEEGTILISTKDLSDNTMPGLSGSPVVDKQGDLIGIMSQKAGKLERLSSIEYPKELIGTF